MGVIVPNPTVTEIDGTPSVANVKTIKVSNGTLSVSGRTATVTTGGGGGGGGVTAVSGTTPVVSSGGTTPAISLTNGGISSIYLATDAVTSLKIADSNVTTDKIADGNITSAKLGDDSVVTAKIANNSVTTAKIIDDAITTAKITNGNITSAKLGTNSVIATKIAGDAVTSTKIMDDAVISTKILDGAVVSGKLATNSIVAANITDGVVGVAKLTTSGGTPSATTFYRGDGSWATPAGGGGGSNDFDVKLVSTGLDSSGSDYKSWPIMMMAPYGTGTHSAATIDTKVCFFPWIAPASGDFSKMYWVFNSSSSTSMNVFIGIYSNGTGNIPASLLGRVTIDGTGSGAGSTTSFSSTITVVQGTQYWLATGKSGTSSVSFAGCRGTDVPSIGPQSSVRQTYVSQCLQTTSAKTELPATVTEDDLEPGFAFIGLNLAPNIGVEIT
jgi:hypothetical protein